MCSHLRQDGQETQAFASVTNVMQRVERVCAVCYILTDLSCG